VSVASTMSPVVQLERLTRFLEDEQRRKFFGTITLRFKSGVIVQVDKNETLLTENLK
jgi:hypothetical protein